METPEFIALEAHVSDGLVHLRLSDGSLHAFPVEFYPILVNASSEQLQQIELRVGGRALRWNDLDEDIWVADAVLGKYPSINAPSAA